MRVGSIFVDELVYLYLSRRCGTELRARICCTCIASGVYDERMNLLSRAASCGNSPMLRDLMQMENCVRNGVTKTRPQEMSSDVQDSIAERATCCMAGKSMSCRPRTGWYGTKWQSVALKYNRHTWRWDTKNATHQRFGHQKRLCIATSVSFWAARWRGRECMGM